MKRIRRRFFASLTFTILFVRTSHGQQPTGQTPPPETAQQRVERLSAAVSQVQAQMKVYETQLRDLQTQLGMLQEQMAKESGAAGATATAPETNHEDAGATSASVDEIKERQAIDESQIATHEQSKVETASKYPLKITGLLLFNSYVNTRGVDVPVNPTYAVGGSGTTGLSLRQTVLGFDARGPRLYGATSYADVRVDFFGSSGSQANYAATGLLRLRTAHAGLKWKNTDAFVALDRPLIAPNVPTSLVAASQSNLAWSGDLWMWMPQIGVNHSIGVGESKRINLQAALIEAPDPLLPGTAPTVNVSRAERSRWPGTEARVAFASGEQGVGPEIGIGGYFSPHKTSGNSRFNAWAGTVDLRLPMGRHLELTSNAYRGQALGGLGGSGYVDYYYYGNDGGIQSAHALDDVGGWAQLKGKVSERLQLNGGFGIDNPFSKEIREAAADATTGSGYAGLAKNRSVFGHVIYSPSSYLLFSLEYRKLRTSFANQPSQSSDVIGIGAGYKF